ncbi:hypothetical protein B0T26DRAFT_769042 [Lasiosphaeria miniovina]|uniref:G domain-containing protein n=1 Tax=Lasiosphaeria miniovina TaxID=1954250 RepID=A0AA40E288_9PEZI|nr:uncharacterized protein B0T26DRAFT_769042 [Lasiosphaeria miniovina]KAK0721566.1 hypothetical protein B0T26DRAFT_769042 [Lasiosphaeria miniovina]
MLMGVTGAGKSTFISLLAEQPVQVGHSLQSCTVDIGIYSFVDRDSGRTVYLVDTPGFDDTARSDTEILRDTALFLAMLYRRRVRLAGLVYLHRITDPRMQGTTLKSLDLFKKLCGPRALPAVVLATTMWPALEAAAPRRTSDRDRELAAGVGQQRESDLLKAKFWGEMVKGGSRMVRHDGTAVSAHAIVRSLVGIGGGGVVLDIQVQLVDEERTLDATAVGQLVQREMAEARWRFEADRGEYVAGMEQALADSDAATFRELRAEKEALEAHEVRRAADAKNLAVSLRQLALESSGRYQAIESGVQQQQQFQFQGFDEEQGDAPSLSGELLAMQSQALRVQRELRESFARRQDADTRNLLHSYQVEIEAEKERARATENAMALRMEQARREQRQTARSMRQIQRQRARSHNAVTSTIYRTINETFTAFVPAAGVRDAQVPAGNGDRNARSSRPDDARYRQSGSQ